ITSHSKALPGIGSSSTSSGWACSFSCTGSDAAGSRRGQERAPARSSNRRSQTNRRSLAPESVRRNHALRPGDEQQDEQRDRKRDSDREGGHHLLGLALVVDEMKEARAEAHDDREQAGDDQ